MRVHLALVGHDGGCLVAVLGERKAEQDTVEQRRVRALPHGRHDERPESVAAREREEELGLVPQD